jgi:hypothetical protein
MPTFDDPVFNGLSGANEIDAISPKPTSRPRRWYASRAINPQGGITVLNAFANDESEASAVYQGLSIAYGLTAHGKAEDIGSESDFNSFEEDV